VTHSGPEVLFKTCVAMKFVDDDDDDDKLFSILINHNNDSIILVLQTDPR